MKPPPPGPLERKQVFRKFCVGFASQTWKFKVLTRSESGDHIERTKLSPLRESTAQKNETMNDDVSLSSTRTCLFTAANDRSHKCSTGTYRETSIVPTSCTKHTQRGTVQGGHGGEHGDKEDTYCTLSSNTPVLTPPPYRKRIEAWWRRGGREREGRERRGRGWVF